MKYKMTFPDLSEIDDLEEDFSEDDFAEDDFSEDDFLEDGHSEDDDSKPYCIVVTSSESDICNSRSPYLGWFSK